VPKAEKRLPLDALLSSAKQYCKAAATGSIKMEE
jgi:hypothetical protein